MVYKVLAGIRFEPEKQKLSAWTRANKFRSQLKVNG
jgi:hypothetical protein